MTFQDMIAARKAARESVRQARKKQFTDPRQGTGTREWSEHSCNVGLGCSNGCIYCYARHRNEIRFKTIVAGTWSQERPNMKRAEKRERSVGGVTMFPTQHDITEAYLPAVKRKIERHLQAGNRLLIVTKPRMAVFCDLLNFLAQQHGIHAGVSIKEKILFRISITSLDRTAAAFWEPGAPTPDERLTCLREAYRRGFQTSISAEPVLPDNTNYSAAATAIFIAADPFITETAWFGTLNEAADRIRGATPELLERVAAFQAPTEVLKFVAKFSPPQLYPKVHFKDSIKKIIKEDIDGRDQRRFEV